jgi:hypothetical protein
LSHLSLFVKSKTRDSYCCIAGFKEFLDFQLTYRPKSPVRAMRRTAAETGTTLHGVIICNEVTKCNTTSLPTGQASETLGVAHGILLSACGVKDCAGKFGGNAA